MNTLDITAINTDLNLIHQQTTSQSVLNTTFGNNYTSLLNTQTTDYNNTNTTLTSQLGLINTNTNNLALLTTFTNNTLASQLSSINGHTANNST